MNHTNGRGKGGAGILAMQRDQAVKLRIQGATFAEIGKLLTPPVTESWARRLVVQALESSRPENVAQLRKLEQERLDRLIFAVWAKALRGDTQAVLSVLRIMERRAKLLGLDAPMKIDWRESAAQTAKDLGLDPAEVLAEAESIFDEEHRGYHD